MSRHRILSLAMLALIAAAGACGDSSGPVEELSDEQIDEDLALTSGEAIVEEVTTLIGNEGFAGFSVSAPSYSVAGSRDLEVTRTRTCFDENGVEQAECHRLTTSYVEIHVEMHGSRAGEHASAEVDRVRDLTISGLLGQETSRTHDGVGTSEDVTTISGERGSREVTESAIDSIRTLVFNLPHANNPWPVSGSIVRRVEGSVTMTRDGNTETRTFSRRIEVQFPADDQGNVTILVGDRECTLNLVTRRITGCGE